MRCNLHLAHRGCTYRHAYSPAATAALPSLAARATLYRTLYSRLVLADDVALKLGEHADVMHRLVHLGAVGAAAAGGLAEQMNWTDGLAVQGLIAVYNRVTGVYGAISRRNAREVARKSAHLVLGMLEDLRVIAGASEVRSMEELSRRISVLRDTSTNFPGAMDLLAQKYPAYRTTILKHKFGFDPADPTNVVAEIFRQYRNRVLFGAFQSIDQKTVDDDTTVQRGKSMETQLGILPSRRFTTRYVRVLEWLVTLEDKGRATQLGMLYKAETARTVLRDFVYDAQTVPDTARLLRDMCRVASWDCTAVWDTWERLVRAHASAEVARAMRDRFASARRKQVTPGET